MFKKCDLCNEFQYFSKDVLDCDMCELNMKMDIIKELKRKCEDCGAHSALMLTKGKNTWNLCVGCAIQRGCVCEMHNSERIRNET